MEYLKFLSYIVFVLSLGYYAICTLQWYSYKLERVIFHHTKPWWNLVYFLIPAILYMFVEHLYGVGYAIIAIYLVALYFWYKSLDKPLVWTGRVKRYYIILLLLALISYFIFDSNSVLASVLIAFFISFGIEKILFNGYKSRAKLKLEKFKKLQVVGVTASYGKTSIKNYISAILAQKYNTYATPRSVNTLGGVIKDINDDLPDDSDIYVVEMGARAEGDIADISTLVNPHYVVVGKIGPAHLEYFKSMENIRNTKLEIMQSSRIKEAWIHDSAYVRPEENIHIFGPDIKNIKSTLDGVSFTLDDMEYSAPILGEFNAMNLAAAIKVAKALGLTTTEIQKGLAGIKPVEHRLQRIDAGGKIILDDSFNGNIDGMLSSFDLVSTHQGRKVIVTPGLVEVDDELNIQVAEKANKIFDLVIVTGDLNYSIFKDHIDNNKLMRLESKDMMQDMLSKETKSGDLILFANDAPSFI